MNRHWICVWGTSSAVFACVLVGIPPQAAADVAANSEMSQPVLTDSRLGGPQLNAFAAMVDEPERVSCRKTRQKFAFSSGRMEMGSCRPDTLPT
jgi:hypothetical protein